MHKRPALSGVIWGVATIIAAAPMLAAGVQEILAYWGWEVLPVVLGSLGALASGLLLGSGVALVMRRPSGPGMAAVAAVGMIAVHLVGWVLGIVGHSGALTGIAYPLLLLIVLRARPKPGGPMKAVGVDTEL